MIRYGGSLEVATNVLQWMMDNYRSTEMNAYVGAYQNGREQGYSISRALQKGYERTVYFAQDRGSDDIVVYFGNHSMQSISDELYKSARFFKHDDISGATEYIYQCLQSCPVYENDSE